MVIWSIIIFILGLFTLINSFLPEPEPVIFQACGIGIMLVSLGVLYRIEVKVKKGEKEAYQRRLKELEKEVQQEKEEKE
ncbi:MAG: hypothetical protein B6D65_05825 [candidate division Zixibacteria bacterium 4484_93]|nr:MAG: hypothetical protein B6D65_05825 [candidate division Zixibacteria bacterium 4484_93]